MHESVVDAVVPGILGQGLQKARRARGLTQQEVADSLELARTTVTALEKGERRIRLDELISLAGLYGRQVSTFVGSRVSPNQRPPGGWWRQELRTRRSSTRGDGAMGTWWPGIPGARSRERP